MEESTRGVSVFYCCEQDNSLNDSNMQQLTVETKSLPLSTENDTPCTVNNDLVQLVSEQKTEKLRLCGWLTKIGTVGFVKTNRLLWFVFGDDNCKLYFYRNPNDLLPQGEIDISNASFYYGVNKDKLQTGVLEIRSDGKTHYLDAQDRPKMLYWLQELQRKRREYSKKRTSLSSERMQLTIQKRQQTSGLLGTGRDNIEEESQSKYSDIPSLILPNTESNQISVPQKPSSFPSNLKSDIRNVLSSIRTQIQSPTDKLSPQHSPLSLTSSEDWAFVESDSMDNQSISEAVTSNSKTHPKFLSTLKKIRIGKRTSSDGNIKLPTSSSSSCVRCKHFYEENISLKDDLRATEEELHAHREIVKLLQKELDTRTTILNTSMESENKEKDELLEMLKDRDKHIVELEHGLSLVQEEKSMLVQQTRCEIRQLQSECSSVKEHSLMLQEMLLAKNEVIEKLTTQIYELDKKTTSSVVATNLEITPNLQQQQQQQQQQQHSLNFHLPSAKDFEDLKDACTAYEVQNKFLSKEILELNELRQHDVAREKMLLINTAKVEGDFLQTRSKYLYLLKDLESPQLGGEEEIKRQDVINQLLQDAMESEKSQRDADRRQLFLSSQNTQEYDKYGFQKLVVDEDEDIILARARQLQQQSDALVCNSRFKEDEEATSHHVKWENFMVGQSGKYLTRCPELKILIRLGIPHEYREQIWRGCINLHVAETKSKLGTTYYKDLVKRAKSNKYNPAAKQIELDLLRTLPTNLHFESLDSDGIRKLRQVLSAYSMHNPVIGYCQGLNRLAAIALLFLTEEESFWCLVAIVDYIMPVDYYTKTLAAAQADQRVLKDLIQEKLPKLYSHFETYEVDLSLFTFNWFLTVFVDNVPPETFLKVWDSFLYEGSKVMFRFAMAFLKNVEEEILKQTSSLAINRYMREIGEKIDNSKRIAQIAFHDLNPFPMKSVSSRRLHHLQQIRNELAELDILRQKFSSREIPNDRRDYYSDDDLDM